MLFGIDYLTERLRGDLLCAALNGLTGASHGLSHVTAACVGGSGGAERRRDAATHHKAVHHLVN